MSIGPLIPADEPKPRPSERWSRRLRNRALNLVEVAVIFALLSFLAGLMGEFYFLLDLASHFRIQAGLVALLGGLILWVLRDVRFGAFACLTGAALLLSTIPYFWPAKLPDGEAVTTRLLLMNVLKENQEKQAVIDYLRDQDPDVIVLLEVDPAWEAAVSPALVEVWPYQETIPLHSHYGIGIYSKLQWTSARRFDLTDFQVPVLELQFEDQAWRLLGTHALSPLSSRTWRARNEQLAALAELVKTQNSSRTIVVGDLNCTIWSPALKKFMKATGLRDAALGQGLKFTWRVDQLPLAGLPIDQVLVGPEIGVATHQVGPPLGSDHRAVTVDFVLE